ncbi:MAG: HicA protein [Desulfovibrionaceae bacterium]|nr:HicA protein [Desulfovibrionaceae bacterium]
MNNKHRKTLQAVFGSPVPKELPWADLESLLVAVGAMVTEGDGSRVKFDIKGVTAAFHRPHRPKTARAYQVALAREFLESIGVKL